MAAFSVQRGSETLAAGTTSATIDLATPVAVGESFPIVTVRSNHNNPSRTFVTAVLSTESGGNYTQLVLTRQFATSTDATVEWQVVTGTDFTVQTGTVLITDTEEDQTISDIDQTKAFVVFSFNSNQTQANSSFPRLHFTSDTNLRININTTGGSTNVRWYVVEWDGATVQSGETTQGLTEGFQDVAISTINLKKAFSTFSYTTTNTNQCGFSLARCFFLDEDTLRMFRWFAGTSTSTTFNWFVISHPEIEVRNDIGIDISGSSNVFWTQFRNSAAFDDTASFVIAPPQGNATNSNTTSANLSVGYTTHSLESSGDDYHFKRGATAASESAFASAAAVQYAPAVVKDMIGVGVVPFPRS